MVFRYLVSREHGRTQQEAGFCSEACHCPLSSGLTTVSTGQGLYLDQVATALYKNVKTSFLPFQFEEGEEGEEEVRPGSRATSFPEVVLGPVCLVD